MGIKSTGLLKVFRVAYSGGERKDCSISLPNKQNLGSSCQLENKVSLNNKQGNTSQACSPSYPNILHRDFPLAYLYYPKAKSAPQEILVGL